MIRVKLNKRAALVILAVVIIIASGDFVRAFAAGVDDGDLSAIRYDKWKIVFNQQKATGMDVWREPFIPVRFPFLVDLRADPYERAMHQAPAGAATAMNMTSGTLSECIRWFRHRLLWPSS